MSFCDYLENGILNEWFGAAAPTIPGTLYIGLSTTAPADDGTNITEPGFSYARVAVVNNLTNWPSTSNGSKHNGTAITFPTASGLWGSIGWFFVSDLASGGNILASGSLTTPKTYDTGDVASFAPGDLVISLD